MGNLYLMSDGGKAIAAHEQLYESESDLQIIVAENPHLLVPSESMQGQDLMLVRREYPITDPDDDSISYSLDHLFLDQDGIPVLVEVKRSSDTRIRREVVGQMIDYASRARYWNISDIQDYFREANGDSPYDNDEFWAKVSTNLKAEKMKLVFVADSIPSSLATLIGFLNRSMSNIEVYGVEIKPYGVGSRRLLTSNIVGYEEIAEKRQTQGVEWNAEKMLQALSQSENDELIAPVTHLFSFSEEVGLQTRFGTGSKHCTYNAYWESIKLFSIDLNTGASHRCIIEIPISKTVAALQGRISSEEIRALFSSFPSVDQPDFVNETPNYEYIDMRLLTHEANLYYFKNSITKIVEKAKEASQ